MAAHGHAGPLTSGFEAVAISQQLTASRCVRFTISVRSRVNSISWKWSPAYSSRGSCTRPSQWERTSQRGKRQIHGELLNSAN